MPETVDESHSRSDELFVVTRLSGPGAPAANSSDRKVLPTSKGVASSVPINRRLDDTELDVSSPSIRLVHDG